MELIYNFDLLVNAKDLEQKAHKHFSEFRGVGEWFNISPDMAVNYIESIEDLFLFDPVVTDYLAGIDIDCLMEKYNKSRPAIVTRIGNKMKRNKHTFASPLFDDDFISRVNSHR